MVVCAACLKRLGESGLMSGDLEKARASLRSGFVFFIVVIPDFPFEIVGF
jgi:hypothetical protein